MDHNTPQDAFLSGNFGPISTEDDFTLPVSGKFPSELNGALYRNGPNPQFEAWDKRYHWFGGDGMIHRFEIENGAVQYSNRWVRTNRWKLENEAGRGLFGSLGNPMRDASVADVVAEGIANTNIISHGGRLLALEEAHAPIEMQPGTLETSGPVDFGGRMTAHPKIDPATGEMIFFACGDDSESFSRRVSWGRIDAAGELLMRETFDAPYCSMIHDFIVTEHHVAFPVLPITGSLDRAKQGLPAFAWDPAAPALIGVMRRDEGVNSLRWFRIEKACYVYHVMNAYEDGRTLVMDVMKTSRPPLFPETNGQRGDEKNTFLTRWRIDLDREDLPVQEQQLSELSGEFPRHDERFAGLPYTQAFYVGQQQPGGITDSIVHLDLATGREQVFKMPEGDGVSECVFIPRSAAAQEGDGWLLAVVYRQDRDASELLLLNAQDVEAGPIASARVPRRVPFGFHGNWVHATRPGAAA